MEYALYIESDNGGRAVMLRVDNTWYICDCAPSGCFGDIEISETENCKDRPRRSANRPIASPARSSARRPFFSFARIGPI